MVNKKRFRLNTLASITFAAVFFDSLLSYFFIRVGFSRVALLSFSLFLLYFLLNGFHRTLPPLKISLTLFFAVLSFITGIALVPSIGLSRVPEIFSCILAFIVGFNLFFLFDKNENLWWFFFLISGLYVLVCTIAVAKIFPSLLPIQSSIWSDGVKLHARPEVMTDQNFQIFYLFPIVAIIVFAKNIYKIIISSFFIALAVYVLISLQTRSGVLILAISLLLSIFALSKTDKFSLGQIIILVAVFFIGTLFSAPILLENAGSLIERIREGGGSDGTNGRLNSFLFLFEKVWNPLYWLPQGSEAFMPGLGYVAKPHSNLTAVFLEAGILGLVCWLILCVYPLILLAKGFLKKTLDDVSIFGFVAGLTVFVTQISLNVPVHDQVWLWAGVTWGCVYRTERFKKAHSSNMQRN